MELTNKSIEIERKRLILFLIDSTIQTREGMSDALQESMNMFITRMRDCDMCNFDIYHYISVLNFGHEAHWIPEFPVSFEDYNWESVNIEESSDFGLALMSLNEKLSVKSFIDDKSSYRCPILVLLKNAERTREYAEEFDIIERNKWYSHSTRFSIVFDTLYEDLSASRFASSEDFSVTCSSSDSLARILLGIIMCCNAPGYWDNERLTEEFRNCIYYNPNNVVDETVDWD